MNQRPEWHAELLTLVESVALGPLTFHLAARQALDDHAASRPPATPPTILPPWTIGEPLPVAELRAYAGCHGWEVFYGSSEGTVRLPVGYSHAAPITVAAYLRDHPDDLVVID